MSGEQTGTVKWFNDQKGYGMITADDYGDDLFVSYKSIMVDGFKTLKVGQKVTFIVENDPRGRQATNVHIA